MESFTADFTHYNGERVDTILIEDSDEEDYPESRRPSAPPTLTSAPTQDDDDVLTFIAYEPPINLHHQEPLPASEAIPINPNCNSKINRAGEDRKRPYCPVTPPTTHVKHIQCATKMPPTPYVMRQIRFVV